MDPRNAFLIALVVVPLVLPVGLAGISNDTRCSESWGIPAMGTTEIGLDEAHTFYVDDRGAALGNGIWTYEESNGVFVGDRPCDDLQFGGSSPYVPADNELCARDAPVICSDDPDTLLV